MGAMKEVKRMKWPGFELKQYFESRKKRPSTKSPPQAQNVLHFVIQ